MKNIKSYAQAYQHQLYRLFYVDGDTSYVTLSEECRSVRRGLFPQKELW